MADLGVNVRPGLVVQSGSGLAVNVDGAIYANPWWPASYVPAPGDNVRVLLCAGEASILGPTIPGQRAATGTVAGSPAGGLLPVTVGTSTVQCRFVGTAPSVGTLVLLSWEATTPWVIGSAATYAPPPGPTPPPPGPTPPPPTTSGTLTLTAIDSATGSSQGYWTRRSVRQGSYGGITYMGAWFYGSAPSQLAGATVTGCRLRLGAREQIGSYNSPITLHVHRVVQGSRPESSLSLAYVDGPNDIMEAVRAPAQWVALPASVGQNLVNAGSGGIGLSGAGYGGVQGTDTDPASGQLALDWTR